MKMTRLNQRALGALHGTGYDAATSPAIVALVAFAAQNPGFDPRDYAGYSAGYRSDSRSASQDWRRFCKALDESAVLGVTDTHVIEQAPRAFSGRLTWIQKTHKGEMIATDWDYCTGQYFPTEYRAAAATLLEYANSEARRQREKNSKMPTTITELKERNRENGGHWFDRSTVKFFNTRIETGIVHGCYFITSEAYDDSAARKYTVRSFNAEGEIDTVGEFCQHGSKEEARIALRVHIAQSERKAA